MKIAKIEPFIVAQQLDEPFFFSQWEYSKRTVCLVKITLENGIEGWGEGYGPAQIIASGINWLAPFIVNIDVNKTGEIWHTMYRRSLDFARSGILLASISAIDVALWDAKGKLYNVPVHELLGGKRREKVKVYATGMYFSRSKNLKERLANEAKKYVEQGYSAMKMKVGYSLANDIKHVDAVRNAIGNSVDLMIDANHAYSFTEAVQLSQALEEYNISWFEEPLSPEDYEGYMNLRNKTSIPIAGGECEYLSFGFKRLLERNCIDIAQPDICASGGLTEVQRILALCRTFHVEMAPHCWGTGIAFAAALHFVASIDINPGRLYEEEPLLEMDRTENPLRDSLTKPNFIAESGFVKIPDSAGLGIIVNENTLDDYLVTGN